MGKDTQKLARAHDANACVFLDLQHVWIAGHDERCTTLNGRGEVLVIIGVLTHAVPRVLAGNQIGVPIAFDGGRMEVDLLNDVRVRAL